MKEKRKKMPLEQIQSEVKEIIAALHEAIAEEESHNVKTSNYKMYKIRLSEALELLKRVEWDIETEKMLNVQIGSAACEFYLQQLKTPIY